MERLFALLQLLAVDFTIMVQEHQCKRAICSWLFSRITCANEADNYGKAVTERPEM